MDEIGKLAVWASIISKAAPEEKGGQGPDPVSKGEKPPGGYVPIPGSKMGGFHIRDGNHYETWYPHEGVKHFKSLTNDPKHPFYKARHVDGSEISAVHPMKGFSQVDAETYRHEGTRHKTLGEMHDSIHVAHKKIVAAKAAKPKPAASKPVAAKPEAEDPRENAELMRDRHGESHDGKIYDESLRRLLNRNR